MQIVIDKEGSAELYLQILKAICGDTSEKSMVDLGCFAAPNTAKLGFGTRTYVDIQDRGLDFKEEEKYFIKSDIVKFMQKGRHFDVSISSDSLEHLPLQKGRLLISLMERYSEKQIVFTPLGKYVVTGDTHPDSHQSGWTPDYFEGWGKVILPNFHPTLNMGAFFVWCCNDIENDFQRVKNELNQ